MACRRRQVISRSSTFKEDKNSPPDDGEWAATSSLAAQAIAASAAQRHSKGGPTYDYTSMGSSNETGSFWGVLARKAKAILEDDNINNQPAAASPHADHKYSYNNNYNAAAAAAPKRQADHHQYSGCNNKPTTLSPSPSSSSSHHKKLDNTPPPSHITCSMRDSLGKTLEEGGLSPAQSKPHESRKIQIVRKGGVINEGHEEPHKYAKNPNTQEDQLKASRDVAMATAAKAKLLLRELKTVKADMAFAKQRCSQLEEENKILRDAREKGVNPEDDDMIRIQLETLLAEKARLAHENSVYARENRVLREIVEYHQLTMQDVIYLDEGTDEVTEVYPMFTASLPHSPTDPTSPPPQISLFRSASASTAEMRFEQPPMKSPSSARTTSSIPRRRT